MYPVAKRLFDILFSLIGLVVLSPLFAIVALLIKLDSEGPVFYRGVRAGKDGKPFRIFKFRTMVVNADKIGGPSTSADDPRLTRVGKILRRYKIDEFPQMINILRGEMSFVGPRPEVLQEVELYTDEERLLLSVPPGMVDYATTRFHNEEEILRGSVDPHQAYREKIRPEKIKLGLEYVRNRSFWGDIKILLQFITTLIKTRV
jgi:lipopolysaccharide/colanic/teichoic acid biosynthesis glycosyltransferase